MAVKKGMLNTQIYSASPDCSENRASDELKDITRVMTCMWPGYVLSVSDESNDMKTKFPSSYVG